jgi:hypothetical protein
MARPALIITVGLIVVGSVLGALCGTLALLPIPLLHALHPSPDDAFISLSEAAPVAAAIGAVLGAVSGPTLAWSLLRRAPIWRVLLEPVVGTIAGSFVGWFVAYRGWFPGIPAILSLAFAGASLAALRLRLVSRAPIEHREAAI